MNKALMIVATAEARPLRWVLALIDQSFRKVAQVGVGGLTPPENVHTYERVDKETGETVLVYDWLSMRLDIVGDDKYEAYASAFATYEISGDTDDLNAATKMQVKLILYRCREDAAAPDTAFWSNERGSSFDIEPVEENFVKVRLKLGSGKGLTILQAVNLSASELVHLTADNCDHIFDAKHRGYALPVVAQAAPVAPAGTPQITPDVAIAAPAATAVPAEATASA